MQPRKDGRSGKSETFSALVKASVMGIAILAGSHRPGAENSKFGFGLTNPVTGEIAIFQQLAAQLGSVR